jgi:hypothetical protein
MGNGDVFGDFGADTADSRPRLWVSLAGMWIDFLGSTGILVLEISQVYHGEIKLLF